MEPLNAFPSLNSPSSNIYKNYGRFPDVLQGNVFSFLCIDEIMNCYSLNKQLHKVVKKIIDTPLVWNQFAKQFYQSESNEKKEISNDLKVNRKYIIASYREANQLISNFFIFIAHKEAYSQKATELKSTKMVLTDPTLNCFFKYSLFSSLGNFIYSYPVNEEGQSFIDQIETFFSSHTLEYPFGSKNFIEVNIKQHYLINRFILNSIPANLETLRIAINSGYLYLFDLCIQKNFKVLPEEEFIEFCKKYIQTPMKKQVYNIALEFIKNQPHDFAERYKPFLSANIRQPDHENIDYLYCDILIRLSHKAEPDLLITVLNTITFFEEQKMQSLEKPPEGFLTNMITLLLRHDWSAYTEFLQGLYNSWEIPPSVLSQFSGLGIGLELES